MNYTNKSFSVTSPGTKEYADNWERTFRAPPKKTKHLRLLPIHLCIPPRVDAMEHSKNSDWIGPLPSDMKDGAGTALKAPVPAERWPYGPPRFHEEGCLLQQRGLYCDCKASAADEPDWGYGA